MAKTYLKSYICYIIYRTAAAVTVIIHFKVVVRLVESIMRMKLPKATLIVTHFVILFISLFSRFIYNKKSNLKRHK